MLCGSAGQRTDDARRSVKYHGRFRAESSNSVMRLQRFQRFSLLSYILVAMATLLNIPPLPHDFKFRVLILGRANAGMTSILRRVCDTTESPEIYRLGRGGLREKVRCRS